MPPEIQTNGYQYPTHLQSPNEASEEARGSSSPLSAPGQKPKQKRNKPTLSCSECVDRKTKCSRTRPICIACLKRQSTCHYSQIADILAAAEPLKSRKLSRSVKNGGIQKCSIANITNLPSPQDERKSPGILLSEPAPSAARRQSITGLGRPAPFNVFGMGSQHPFHNYWTCQGGLPEVVSVLPSKNQADVLVAKYFDAVDPLYPILSRNQFYPEYEHFWSLSLEQKCTFDAAKLALHFVVYATGTQFMDILSLEERVRTAEFYLSASHQALRISSYLNRLSLPTVQAMLLIGYFLVSDNHVSDAWTFSGITIRQAYALQLNRDPERVVPESSFAEKLQRTKLWQAIMFQDTGLSLYLKLPPTTLYYDIKPTHLRYRDDEREASSADQMGLTSLLGACLPHENSNSDVDYLRAMWEYAAFTQQHVCTSRSLGLPLTDSVRHKAQLIASLRSVYRSFPPPFNSYDPMRFRNSPERVARQLIAAASSFFTVLMILNADENPNSGVTVDVYGTLEAAHEGLVGFFALYDLHRGEIDTWWAYQSRAYDQATMIANILAIQKKPTLSDVSDGILAPVDPRFASANQDLAHFLDIIRNARGTREYENIQAARTSTLQAIADTITVV